MLAPQVLCVASTKINRLATHLATHFPRVPANRREHQRGGSVARSIHWLQMLNVSERARAKFDRRAAEVNPYTHIQARDSREGATAPAATSSNIRRHTRPHDP